MKKGLLLLTLAGLCTYAFCACRTKEAPAEESLTPEETLELKHMLAESEADLEADEADDPDEADLCYYLPSGGVFHGDPDCHHIAGKQGVVCATVEQAVAAGKARPCALCG